MSNRRESNRLNAARIRDERRAQRLCVQCGKNPMSPGKVCESCKERGRRYTIQYKIDVFNHYGNECVCCGETESVFLIIDHTEGSGHAHRKSFKGTIYRWLINNNFPPGFQTLCWNCNSAKYILDECPHKERK